MITARNRSYVTTTYAQNCRNDCGVNSGSLILWPFAKISHTIWRAIVSIHMPKIVEMIVASTPEASFYGPLPKLAIPR